MMIIIIINHKALSLALSENDSQLIYAHRLVWYGCYEAQNLCLHVPLH